MPGSEKGQRPSCQTRLFSGANIHAVGKTSRRLGVAHVSRRAVSPFVATCLCRPGATCRAPSENPSRLSWRKHSHGCALPRWAESTASRPTVRRRPLEAKPLKTKTLSVSVEDRTPQSGKSSRNPAKLCQILPLCAIRKENLHSQPATSFLSVARHCGRGVRNVETPERGLPSTPLSGRLEFAAIIGNDFYSTCRCSPHGG